ncbi:hypothetical protein HKX48_008257 [Thoreauomyces humboldtii]|nr:hypothetical protein HKX48_008257 [Thoreauomyces humboldtii]
MFSPTALVASTLHLTKLPAHSTTLFFSTLACHVIHTLSHRISLRYSSHYARLSPPKQADWNMHVVSSVHATLITLAALPIFGMESLSTDKVLAYDPYAGEVYAVAAGYFLWDSVVCLWNVKLFGLGFALHGIACLAVFLLAFRPFLMYYGAAFLMFELSTPFLNVHWFCDKTGRSGSTLQLVNGVLLIAVFFLARIVFGLYNSADFFVTCYQRLDVIPAAYVWVYGIANVFLNGLNMFWLTKMVAAIQSRYVSSKRGNREDQALLNSEKKRHDGLNASDSGVYIDRDQPER